MNTQRAAIVLVTALMATSGACRRRSNPTSQGPGSNGNTTAQNGQSGAPPTGPGPSGPTVSGQNQGESSVRSVAPTPATGCPALMANAALGPGTVHNATVNTNETWTLEGSPHRFPDGADIAANTTVTVAPCAVVLVGNGNGFNVGEGAALMAVGDAQHPIRFGSDKNDPQPGDWDALNFNEQARRSSRLAYVTVEHGGGDSGSDYVSCLLSYVVGLDVQHLTLRACRGFGAFLDRNATFSDTSTDVTVKECVLSGAPLTGSILFNSANSVRTLPEGTYAPNELSEIYVRNAGPITTSGTWRNPGVRYHIADDVELRIEGPTAPVLTIAPSTIIAMGSSSNITVGWDAEGALVADGGSEGGRITFTGAASEPNAGAWEGIFIGERAVRSRTKLAWVNVAYAAGDSAYDSSCPQSEQENDAALYIAAPLAADAISHTRFTGLPENTAAIARSWAANNPAVNFAAPALGNDFSHSGSTCRQTPLRTAEGCGDNARCD